MRLNNSGAGFIPIGNLTTEFTGTYDGDYHSIDGLYINRGSTDRVGFFGRTDGSESITNLGLTNVDITGKWVTGGLIGQSYSSVDNCYTTGTVSGYNSVGGLIGQSEALASISNCYSTATVTGTSTSLGGLVGITGSNISNCFSTGDVTGTDNLGGLIGYIWYEITVSDCYSHGDVYRTSGSTGTSIGAFCGENYYSDNLGPVRQGTIERCYSTGSVTYIDASNPSDKGFCGNNLGTFNDNFFDSDVSNQTSGNGATAKTTSQMQTQSTFTNWNFSTVWQIVGGDGANYPTLINNPELCQRSKLRNNYTG